jgi:hypothetical protein
MTLTTRQQCLSHINQCIRPELEKFRYERALARRARKGSAPDEMMKSQNQFGLPHDGDDDDDAEDAKLESKLKAKYESEIDSSEVREDPVALNAILSSMTTQS